MKTLNISGTTIAYQIDGEKNTETLVLVHGWGGSMQSLQKLAERASTQYRTLRIDLPGFGQSGNPGPDWGVEEYAQCVDKVLNKLGISSCTYFGHSFGGSLGILLATRSPSRIKRLILCNSAYKRTGKKSHKALLIKHALEHIPFFPFVEERGKMLFYRIFFPRSDIARYPHLEHTFRKIMQQDLSQLPEHITVPTLILWGEEDTYTPVSLAHELQEKIPHATLHIVPQVRHNLPIQYPEIVWEKIGEWGEGRSD